MTHSFPTRRLSDRIISDHLFPEEVFNRPEIEEKLKIYRDYQLQVLGEDQSMVESMQKAMNSRAYVPGRMSILEKPLHHYLNGHIDRMFGTIGRETARSEEHTSELQSLMRISYAVFCLTKKNNSRNITDLTVIITNNTQR